MFTRIIIVILAIIIFYGNNLTVHLAANNLCLLALHISVSSLRTEAVITLNLVKCLAHSKYYVFIEKLRKGIYKVLWELRGGTESLEMIRTK